MGNTFTIFGRHALKRARRFNVQNRTEKYLERHKDKPERAPLYEATMKEVEKVMKGMIRKKNYDPLHFLPSFICFRNAGSNRRNQKERWYVVEQLA